jgi:hypothetical protein
MNSAPGDPPVERINNMDFGATESSNVHLYIPKSYYQEHAATLEPATSMQPRFAVALVPTQHIANLQRVLFNVEADKQMRRNALRQLQINVTQRDYEDSHAVLAQWQESGLKLD